MALHLTLTYETVNDLRVYLLDQASHGAILVPVEGDLASISQFEDVTLTIVAGQARAALRAQVLQVLAGTGIVLQTADLGDVELLAASAAVAPPSTAAPRPPTVEIAALKALSALDALGAEPGDTPPILPDGADADPGGEAPGGAGAHESDRSGDGDGGPDETVPPEDSDAFEDLGARMDAEVEAGNRAAGGPGVPLGSSPVSWSIEMLQARWDELAVADRVRVARYGSRPARAFVLRSPDKSLHIHLLQNPNLTAEEVAVMAGMASLDPATLKRIATSVEWQKKASVAKALVCNPKLPLPLVPRLLKNVPRDDLSRLSRTGKVTAAVKQAIVKFLDLTR